jgi:hypothetical protein
MEILFSLTHGKPTQDCTVVTHKKKRQVKHDSKIKYMHMETLLLSNGKMVFNLEPNGICRVLISEFRACTGRFNTPDEGHYLHLIAYKKAIVSHLEHRGLFTSTPPIHNTVRDNVVNY